MVGLRLSRILSETNDKVEFCLGVYVIFWRGTKQGEGLQLSGNQPRLSNTGRYGPGTPGLNCIHCVT